MLSKVRSISYWCYYCRIILFFLPAAVLIPGIAQSLNWQYVRITNTASNKSYVYIYNNRVVWTDNRNWGGTTTDIYCFDLESNIEYPLFIHPASQLKPKIWGDKVVFEDYRDKASPSDPDVNIYMYDFATGNTTRITSDPATQNNPVINGDKILWHDFRNGQYDIYGFDLSGNFEFPLAVESGGDKLYPDLYGDFAVYQKQTAGGIEIHGYDFVSGSSFPVAAGFGIRTSPRINGKRIVWQDGTNFPSTGFDILGFDLVSETVFPVTNISGNQYSPDIWGDLVVWQDSRHGSADIMAFNIHTGVTSEVYVGPGNQTAPGIWEDIVVFIDDRHGHSEVYCARPLLITSTFILKNPERVILRWNSLPGLTYVVRGGSSADSMTDISNEISSGGLITVTEILLEENLNAYLFQIRISGTYGK